MPERAARVSVPLPAWFVRRGAVARLLIVAVVGGALVGLAELLARLLIDRDGARWVGQALFGAVLYFGLWTAGLAPGRTRHGLALGLLLGAAMMLALEWLWPRFRGDG